MERVPHSARGLYFALLGVFITTLLWIDGVTGSFAVQLALGVATWALLFFAARQLRGVERWELWACVLFSTALELFCTQVWGLYHYRLGNLPWYVPPGHGLIFVVSLQASRVRWLASSEKAARVFLYSVFALASAWAAGGLLWPLLHPGAPPDVHGVVYWPVFALLVVRSQRAPAYAWTFLIASFIELIGTRVGTWHWSERVPFFDVTSADPPSAAAGGYCFFGVAAAFLAERLYARYVAITGDPARGLPAAATAAAPRPRPDGSF